MASSQQDTINFQAPGRKKQLHTVLSDIQQCFGIYVFLLPTMTTMEMSPPCKLGTDCNQQSFLVILHYLIN